MPVSLNHHPSQDFSYQCVHVPLFLHLKKISSFYSIFFQLPNFFSFLLLPYYGNNPQNSYLNYCQQFPSSHSFFLDAIPFRLYLICPPNLCFWSHSFLSFIYSGLAILFFHAVPQTCRVSPGFRTFRFTSLSWLFMIATLLALLFLQFLTQRSLCHWGPYFNPQHPFKHTPSHYTKLFFL